MLAWAPCMLSDHLNKRAAETTSSPEEQHPNADMFGRRKRKPEDEPIVPHGMIWYATPSEPVPENEDAFDPAAHYAEAIELMRRAKEPEPEKTEAGEKKTHPVVPWWRVQHPEPEPAKDLLIARRPTLPPTNFSSNIEQNAVQQNSPSMPPETAPEVMREATVAPPAASTNLGNTGAALPGSSDITVWHALVDKYGDVQRRCIRALAAVEARNKLLRGRTQAAELGRQSFKVIRNVAQRGQLSAAKFSRAASLQAQQFTKSFARNVVDAEKTTIDYAKASRLRAPRVRIVLSGLPLKIKIFLARRTSEWKMKQVDSSRDVRLWTSMTLASVAAIIALVIVSMIPHYAAKSLPSKLLNTGSTVNADSAAAPAPVVSSPAVVNASQREAVSSIPVSQTKPEPATTKRPAQKPANASNIKSKPRRHVDDDYVAPDTYKYYGNSSR